MVQDVQVEIGESPQDLLDRYGKAVDVNDKNFGLKFYMISWPTRQPGAVRVRSDRSEFRIDLAYGISGTYDVAYPDEGFSSYDVSCGLSTSETMPHDQARLKFYEMLGRIQKAGWKWLIYQTQPRLSGEDALRYQLETSAGTASLDPNLELSLQDWMRLENRSPWKFYKDGVYMDVRLSRDSKRMRVDEPGAYFVSIALESYQSFWRTTFKEPDRAHWRELLPAVRERQRTTRAEAEQKLQAEGYHIDTSYRNPDEAFDPDAKPAPDPVGSDQPQSPAPQPPSSFKEGFGRWIRGG